MISPSTVAGSEACRAPTLLERAGSLLGRRLKASPLRSWLRGCYHRLLDWRTGGRGFLSRLPSGEKVWIDAAFRHTTWNFDEYHAFRQVLKPGGVALDIGANIGCYTILFGQWVGPAGRVYAFEPAPESFAGLCRHIELNQLTNIVPIEAAVADKPGPMSLLADSTRGSNRLVTRRQHDAGATKLVTVVTVDDFCAEHKLRPNLIKVDVEGFEGAVLRGAMQTVKACRQDLGLFVELHPSIWPEIGVAREDIEGEWTGMGLTPEPLRHGDPLWTVEGICVRLLAH